MSDRLSTGTGDRASGDGVAAVGAGIFGAVARLRGDRALHPQGIAFSGSLELRDGPGLALLASPLDSARTLPATVRLSRGIGLPARLPDFLGVAVRLPDLRGPGEPLDLLMTSSLGGHGGYHLLMAARSFGWRWYSSVIPYRIGGRLVVIGALADHAGGGRDDDLAALDRRAPDALRAACAAAIAGTLRFSLAIAAPPRPFVPFGELRVGPPLPAEQAAALRLDPANCGGEIELAGGPLNPLRAGAYRASRRVTARR